LPSHFLSRLVSAVRVAYVARSLTDAIVSADDVKAAMLSHFTWRRLDSLNADLHRVAPYLPR